jgi:protein TonB
MLVTVAAAGAARAIPLELPALMAAQSHAQLEIRLAEATRTPGLSPAVVAGSGRRVVYLHPSALATNADVESAGVIEWNGTATPDGSAGRAISGFGVAVRFTDAAAARLAAATGAHLGRPIAILVDGRLISAPVLRSAIGNTAVISGSFSEEEARALTEGLDPASAQRTPIADVGDAGLVRPRLIHVVGPTYTSEAMRAGIAGVVVMKAVVNADGSVGDVVVTRSLDQQYGLDEQAVKAAKGWTFAPGTRGGVPVAVRVTLETEFTVRSSR